MDKDEELYKRDFSEATIDEVRHRELLPEVLQVKRFGRAGQTKYTHLQDQDTSRKDTGRDRVLEKKVTEKMGGMRGGFEKPSDRRR